MIILEEFLDENALELCSFHFQKIIDREARGWTNASWSKDLNKNSSLVFITHFKELTDYIHSKLSSFNSWFLYSEVKVTYCIYGPGSKLNLHDDSIHRYAGTIYLNQNWDIEDGGLFMYRPKISKKFEIIVPTFNTAVINVESELHQVTQISPAAKQLRHSIQFWGADSKDYLIDTNSLYYYS